MIRAPTCPVCDKQLAAQAITDSPVFPFCSVRCKQIDLLRWCNGQYAIINPLSPEDVAEKMRPYLGIGFRHFIVGFPSPHDAESMERLAREVRPLVEAGA